VTEAAISLGSNVGDREKNLVQAVRALSDKFILTRVSSVYETDPMYLEAQPAFLNAAATVNVPVGPLSLLRTLKDIEHSLGRTPGGRFGPREIDLDLVAYGSARYRYSYLGEDVLILPHPRVMERRFVLAPLAEIASSLILPGMGKVQDLLDRTFGQESTVRLYSDALLPLLSR
jgi:2-amino-4-hydroxy-6-hydroxymethyldihydropteridine diphosphokinase